MKGTLTKTRFVVICIVLMLLAVYFAGSIYLNSDAFRHQLLQRINAALDGRFTITDHKLALYATRLELYDIELTAPDEIPLVSIQRLRIKLSLPALLWRTVHIKHLEIHNIRCDVNYDDDDRLQWIKSATSAATDRSPSKSDPPWAVRISDVLIDRGSIRYERPAKGLKATVERIQVAGDVDSARPAGQLQIKTGPVEWRQPGIIQILPTLELAASLKADRTVTAKVATPQSSLTVTGRMEAATVPRINMNGELHLQPEEFHAIMPRGVDLKGALDAQIAAQGPLDDPDVTLKTQWTQGEVMGIAISQLEADLRWHQRQLAIKKLESRSDWGEASLSGKIDMKPVFGKRLDWQAAQWENLAYDLKLEGLDLQPDRIKGIRLPYGGPFQLQADLTGQGLTSDQAQGVARIDLKAHAPASTVTSTDTGGHLTAEIRRQGPILDLKQFKGAINGSELEASARLHTSTARIEQGRARLQVERLAALGRLLGVKLPSGTGTVSLQCEGAIKHPTARIQLLAEDLVMGHLPLGRLVGSAQLNDAGILELSRLVLENQGSLAQGSGTLSLFKADGVRHPDPAIDLDLTFQQLEPSDFGLHQWAGSQFKGVVAVDGSLMHPEVRMTLNESDLRKGDFAGRLKGDARWRGGRLTLSDLTLYAEQSSIRAKGTAVWPSGQKRGESPLAEIKGQIDGRGVQLQDFFSEYAGRLDIRADFSGPVATLAGDYTIAGSDLKIDGQPIRHLDIKGRLADNKIHWDAMELAVDQGHQLTSRGWYGFDHRFQVDMAASDLGLSRIVALQRAYPVEGRLNLNLEAHGSIDDPQLEADLSIIDPRLNDQPWNDFHIMARIANGQLKLDADMNFHLRSNYHLKSGDFTVQALFDQSDLSPYLALWAGADWAGVLSGRLHARGNHRRPDQIQGALTLKETEIRYQKQSMIKVPQLHATFENERLDLPPTRLEILESGYVNLQGTGRWPGDFQIESHGRLPLVALAPMVDQLDNARGELAFDARAAGPSDAIQWQAKIDFIETGFEIPGLAQMVEGLSGRLEITPRELFANNLSGTMEGGRFSLNGRMALNQWHPSAGSLNLEAQSLPLRWPDTLDVVVNGDLALKGASQAAPTLTGQLVLLEGSYYKDFKLNLLSALTQTKRAVPVSSPQVIPDPWGKIGLGVAVTHRYPLLVDNNLANLQVAPDLKISGTLASPILSGRAEVVEGQVIFRRKSFEVKRGVVDFINPYKIEPNLDILAQADIRQWQVSLALSGPPNQLMFKLSSNPSASENDILSLILLGRTGQELAAGESGGQTTRQMLASLVATAWGEDLKKHSGVDILEVDTAAGDDPDSADRVQVTVGKRLSRRLTVKYEVESGSDESVQRAISEYRFLEHLLASGFQDSRGDYGGELVFRIEF